MFNFRKIPKDRMFWLLQLVGWGLFGCFDFTVKLYSDNTIATTFIGNLITYSTGFISTSVLRLIYRRIDLRLMSLFKLIMIIIFNGVLFGTIWFYLDHLASIPTAGSEIIFYLLSSFSNLSYRTYNVLIVITWSGIYFGLKYMIESQSQIEKTEEALLRAEIAELKVLRYQLNPHFLFNSLSSLRSLIREDKVRAEEMLTKISDFLRYALSSSNTKEVPLIEEIEAVKNYVEIEKTKHGKKLVVEFEISPLAEEYPIPILLLHPIIENSIKYGQTNDEDILEIRLTANVKRDWLEITVKNRGTWAEQSLKERVNSTKTGLVNVEARLQRYYPSGNEFIIDKKSNYVCVTIKYKKDLNRDNE